MSFNVVEPLFWNRANVVWTFHLTDFMCFLGRCLDPMMICSEHDATTRGEGVIYILLTTMINAFDESHHWWRLVVITCRYRGYLPSRILYVSVVLMSWSGDGILQTWCNLMGCYSLCWPLWSMLLMNVIIADVMWWLRHFAARTCHCMQLWFWILDLVMGCWQFDGPQLIVHDL